MNARGQKLQVLDSSPPLLFCIGCKERIPCCCCKLKLDSVPQSSLVRCISWTTACDFFVSYFYCRVDYSQSHSREFLIEACN